MTRQPGMERLVRCPACGGPSRYAGDNRFRPFCSERCRTADLGAWASESYRVAQPLDPHPDDESGSSPGVPRAEH